MIHACSLLVTLFLQPVVDERTAILSEWKQRADQIESGDIAIAIDRDSRDATFGRPRTGTPEANIRIRFNRDLIRFDGPRLTVVRRDGRTQAAEADTDRARMEFRNVLLEERLAAPQATPRFEPATWILQADGRESGERFAFLDRLLAEGAIRASQPLRLLDPERLQLLPDSKGQSARRLLEKRDGGVETELWIERTTPYRPLRVIGRENRRDVWQVDVEWTEFDRDFPFGVFVQTIGQAGESLDSVDASLRWAVSPLDVDAAASLATLDHLNRDEPRLPNPSSVKVRRVLRLALDSNWLPAMMVAMAAAWTLRRRS